MEKRNLLIALFLGLFAVILGAFGAHALKEQLSTSATQSFEVGVKYQMYHALFLLFVNSYQKISLKRKGIISWVILLGIICFSGSIYAIALGTDPKLIWFITPFGGLLLITAWFITGMSILKSGGTEIK